MLEHDLREAAPLLDNTFSSSTWRRYEKDPINPPSRGLFRKGKAEPCKVPEGHVGILGSWPEDGSIYVFYVPHQLATSFMAMQRACREVASRAKESSFGVECETKKGWFGGKYRRFRKSNGGWTDWVKVPKRFE